MKMLRLYSEEDLAQCPLDKWGILDPGTHRRELGKEREVREDGPLFRPLSSQVLMSSTG